MELHTLVVQVKSQALERSGVDDSYPVWPRIMCGDEEFAWLGDNFFNTVVRWRVLKIGREKGLCRSFQRMLASKIHSKKLMYQLAVWIGLVDEIKLLTGRDQVSCRAAAESLEACLGFLAIRDESGKTAINWANQLINCYWDQAIEYVFTRMLRPDDMRLVIFTADPKACLLEAQEGSIVVTRVQRSEGSVLPYFGQGRSTASSRHSLFSQLQRRHSGFVDQIITLLSSDLVK